MMMMMMMMGVVTMMILGQFGTADNLAPRTIWHPDNLAPSCKTDNLAPRTIWHRHVKTDNLAPPCKNGQFGTTMKNGQFGTIKFVFPNPAPEGRTDNFFIIF